jgi:hypothetical protein
MRTVNLGQLKVRVRELADQQTTAAMVSGLPFISDEEIVRYLDAAYTDLVDQLAAADINLFETYVDITATGTEDGMFLLPGDHYKSLAVDFQVSTTWFEPLRPIQFADRNSYRNMSGPSRAYRVAAGALLLYPPPAGGEVYRHHYVPAPAELSLLDDDEPIDGIAGWDEFLVVGAAKRCLLKEDSYNGQFDRIEAKLESRIAQMAADRMQPARVVDVRRGPGSRDAWWRRGMLP